MSDLRFEATAKKKQVITCKRSRVRNKIHRKKRREIVKNARMRENKTGQELM